MATISRRLMALIQLSMLTMLILFAGTASNDAHDAQAGPSLQGGTSTNDTATSVTLAAQGTSEECGPDWKIVDMPPATDSSRLFGVSALAPDDVWAVGRDGAGTFWTHWDGQSWNAHYDTLLTGTGLSGVVAVASDDVWATQEDGVQDSLIMHWDGTQYDHVPGGRFGIKDQLYAIAAVSANDIWAVGKYDDLHNVTLTLIEHWDGPQGIGIPKWRGVPSPNREADSNELHGVSAVSTNDVWAVGFYDNGDVNQTLIEHWDGSQWSIVSSPNVNTSVSPANNELSAVAAVSANDVWAVGLYSGAVNQTLIEHWDGSQWSIVPSPNPEGPVYTFLNSVSAVSANDVWAVGSYIAADNSLRTLVEHWDGSQWSIVPSPNKESVFNILYGVSADSANDVWAVGYYEVPNSTSTQPLMLRYNPCAPTPTSTPTSNATSTVVLTPAPAPTYPPVAIPGLDSRYFPQTGKTVKGIFLDYWNNHGGLAQQGYPISDMFGEVSDLNGQIYTVQYFERAVFEYHPENAPPNDVLLSLLGYFTYKQKYLGPEGAPYQNNFPPAGALVFPETGKWVAGGFLVYWKEHGGLAQQGYPISNEFQEQSATDGKEYPVQYFQRAVFEYHPEFKDTPNEVLLSLLGTFRYVDKYPGK